MNFGKLHAYMYRVMQPAPHNPVSAHFFHSPKAPFCPFAVHPFRQGTTDVLQVIIVLPSLEFHTNGII